MSLTCSLPLVTCYALGLFSVNPTNYSPTICQHPTQSRSLKTVSASLSKQLQNVLPKCNPFYPQIEYTIYGVVGICHRHIQLNRRPHLKMNQNIGRDVSRSYIRILFLGKAYMPSAAVERNVLNIQMSSHAT